MQYAADHHIILKICNQSAEPGEGQQGSMGLRIFTIHYGRQQRILRDKIVSVVGLEL